MAFSSQSQNGYGTLGSDDFNGYKQGPPPTSHGQNQFVPKNMIPPNNAYDNLPEEQYAAQNEPLYDAFEFTDQTVRKAFIRKVYSILMVQLLVTFMFIILFNFNDTLKTWTHANPWFFYGALAITLVTLIAMACCENVRRHAPQNFIFLGIFTVAEGFVLGAATSTYDTEAIMLAVGITAVVCLALTVFAFQTKWDFTAFGGILLVALVILFLFGILAAIFRFPILQLVYACCGALLFSVYLVYDTQLMMGGKHRHSISPEEYIFAALNLYLDIINIFVSILSIISATRD